MEKPWITSSRLEYQVYKLVNVWICDLYIIEDIAKFKKDFFIKWRPKMVSYTSYYELITS